MYDAVCSRLPSFVRVDKRNTYLTLTCTNLKTTFRSPRSSSRPTIPSVLYDQSRTLKTGSGIVPEDSHTQENQQNCDCTILILLSPGSESDFQAPQKQLSIPLTGPQTSSAQSKPPPYSQKTSTAQQRSTLTHSIGAHTLITGRHGIYIYVFMYFGLEM